MLWGFFCGRAHALHDYSQTSSTAPCNNIAEHVRRVGDTRHMGHCAFNPEGRPQGIDTLSKQQAYGVGVVSSVALVNEILQVGMANPNVAAMFEHAKQSDAVGTGQYTTLSRNVEESTLEAQDRDRSNFSTRRLEPGEFYPMTSWDLIPDDRIPPVNWETGMNPLGIPPNLLGGEGYGTLYMPQV